MDISGYNEKQQKAITCAKRQVMVLAGAGTGKTKVLTGRVAWHALHNGINPREIMAITFSTMAANQMLDRLSVMIPRESLIWVRTVHSLCLMILKEFAPAEWRPGGIIAGRTRLEYIQEAVQSGGFSEKEFPVQTLLGFIDRVKMAEFPEDQLRDNDQKMTAIYHAYQNHLEVLKLMDFSDLIDRVRKLFEQVPAVVTELRRQIKQILVDEFQDLDPAQFSLIRALAGGEIPLCVVGDDDQAIYQFRGSSPKIFNAFREIYSPGEITLDVSYRCTETILASAERLIRHNTTRVMEKRLKSARSEDGVITVKGFRMPDEEVKYLCSEIKSAMKSMAPSQIAVLSRTRGTLEAIRTGLIEAKIPVYRPAVDFYQTKEFADLSAWLQLICFPSHDAAFVRALMAPKRGLDEGVIGVLKEVSAKYGLPLFQSLVEEVIPLNLLGAERSEILKGFVKQYTQIQEIAQNQPTQLRQIIQSLLSIIGFESFLATQVGSELLEKKRANIQTLLDMARGYEEEYGSGATLMNFVNELALETLTPASIDHKGVMLLTFHAAKGLEFEQVFLAGVEHGVIPHVRSDIEDERRLMYVAATRAISRLVMTWVEYRGRHRGMPSLFIEEMKEAWKEKSLFFPTAR